MAGVVIYRRPISVEEAEQQFDLLFDEYFKDDFGFHAQGLCFASGSRSEQEEDFKVILDGGSPGMRSLIFLFIKINHIHIHV
jgi:hypothetical protein